jgi:hypothetical protein
MLLEFFCSEYAAACDAPPFAGYIVCLDVGFDGVDILELEGCDGGGAVEEEGLAVAAIL